MVRKIKTKMDFRKLNMKTAKYNKKLILNVVIKVMSIQRLVQLSIK